MASRSLAIIARRCGRRWQRGSGVPVFVDTSGFYALADRADPDHAAVVEAAGRLGARGLVTSDYVFVESYLLIEARLGSAAARRFWAALRGGAARIAAVQPMDVARAWEIDHAREEHELGIVDATSFALMERLGLQEAISLDRHFAIYRFGPGRRRRFRLAP